MLSASNEQIIQAYEFESLTVDEIADALGYDVTAVKATLMQFSAQFREDIKAEPALDFTTNEQEEAKNAMIRLMRTSEDENLVARLAMKIRDDGKGRLDIGNKLLKGLNINVNLMNLQLAKAREAKERGKLLNKPKPAPAEPIEEAIEVEGELQPA